MTTKPADVARRILSAPVQLTISEDALAMARVVLAAEKFMEARRVYQTDTDMTFGVDRQQYRDNDSRARRPRAGLGRGGVMAVKGNIFDCNGAVEFRGHAPNDEFAKVRVVNLRWR